jgi:hypothetical protein
MADVPQIPWAALLRPDDDEDKLVPPGIEGQTATPAQAQQAAMTAKAAVRATGSEEAATQMIASATRREAAKDPSLLQGETLRSPMLDQQPPPWAALAQRAAPAAVQQPASMAAPQLYQPLEAPPAYAPPSTAGNITALVLDGLLNKGRNAGRIVSRLSDSSSDGKYADYERKVKAAKDAATIDATRRRGIESPEDAAYKQQFMEARMRGLSLRERGLDTTEAREGRLGDKQDVELNPDNPATGRVLDMLAANGVDTAPLKGMSIYEMKQVSPATKIMIEDAMSGQIASTKAETAGAVARAQIDPGVERARRTAEVTQPYKIELAEIQNQFKQAGEERADGRQQRSRDEDYAWKYAKETEKDLGIARLMDDIDASGGAAPETLAERLKGPLAGWGIGTPERLENWQAKRMVLELWSRQQSGAAINMSEDDNYRIQTGLSPTASPGQVDAAYKVMSNVLQTWLRSKAAGNPDAARKVLDASGASSERWLGPAERKRSTVPASAPSRPRVRPAAGDDGWQDVGGPKADDGWKDI